MFAVPNNQKCPVKAYKAYAEKRPAEMETNDAPFPLTVLNVKSGNKDVPPTDIMQLSGHKNVQSFTRYSNVSQKQQLNMSHTLIGTSSREIAPQSGSSIPEKRKHKFDELNYPTFRPTFSLWQAAQQPLSLFWGAVFKINMVEGTNESFLARKLNELKISNSSGPCACIHLLLVSIVRSFTLQHGLHAQRKKQTLTSRSLSSFKMHLQILKVLMLSYRWKRFRIPGGRLFWRQTSRRG